MKKVKQTILYLVAFAVALFLLMAVINLPVFDEELLPEVKTIKNIKAKTFDTNNAYLSMWAFGTKKEQPFSQTVNELRTHINQKIRQNGIDILSAEEVEEFVGGGNESSWKNQYIKCNSREDATCMQQYIEQLSDKEFNDERLLELMSRYQALMNYQSYQESVTFDLNAPMMGYGTLLDVKKISLVRAYHEQTPNEFLHAAEQDMAFWRMVLAQSHYLLTKMIAVSSLRDSIGALSQAIKNNRFTATHLKALSGQLNELTGTEKDLSKTFEFEFKYGVNLTDKVEAEQPIGITSWVNFFQINATHNTNYSYVTKPLGEISKLDSMSLYQKVNSSNGGFESPVNWSPTMIYNPTGKLMTGNSISIPAYSHYLGRVHDLGGMISLLKLQIETVLNPNQKVEQTIESSQYSNPYTGESFNYNKSSNSIYFECLDPHSSCELLL